jgi:muramoyltetrapeptide carboxypeptidase
MDRREFLKVSTLTGMAAMLPASAIASHSTAGTTGREMIRPPTLKKGDLVAIIAPAGASDGPANLETAKKNVESLGYEVVVSPNAGDTWGYLAGEDKVRADDFNWAVRDRDIKGVFCLRGGYGTTRMLPFLDYAAFRKNPKVITGYSDITGILNALTRLSQVVTFHGPIAEATFEHFEGDWFARATTKAEPLGVLATPLDLKGRPVNPVAVTIQPGVAQGRLIGGNLSLLNAVMGSKYAPDYKDAILFIEDTGEAPYRIDRMLTGLWLSGDLGKLRGIVIADFRPRKEDLEDNSDPSTTFSMMQVFENLRLWTKVPIYTGLYAGHIKDKLTLPIGALAKMDAAARTLEVLEPCVEG